MVRINFDISEGEYTVFRDLVGRGRVSQSLKGFIRGYANSKDLKEDALRKKFEIIKKEKERIDAEFVLISEQLASIESKRRADELALAEAKAKEVWL